MTRRQMSPPRSRASFCAVLWSVPNPLFRTSLPVSSSARQPIWAEEALAAPASTCCRTWLRSRVEVAACRASCRLRSSQMLLSCFSYSSALRAATTPWLPSVESTRWSSSVHSRFLVSKTVSVPQSPPSSSIGMQMAASIPAPTRSPAERSSGSDVRSETAVARRLSMVAPTMPCPLRNSEPSSSAENPTDMMTTWLPSTLDRVSSPAAPSTTRIAVSSVFFSTTRDPWVTVVSAAETSPRASRSVSSREAWPATTCRTREFSTATPAMDPSSSRAAMSCRVKLEVPRRPRHSAPMTPVLPRIGISASFTVTACSWSLRPLNVCWSSVTALRRIVSPSRTCARASSTGVSASKSIARPASYAITSLPRSSTSARASSIVFPEASLTRSLISE